jgi:hypothetical protein
MAGTERPESSAAHQAGAKVTPGAVQIHNAAPTARSPAELRRTALALESVLDRAHIPSKRCRPSARQRFTFVNSRLCDPAAGGRGQRHREAPPQAPAGRRAQDRRRGQRPAHVGPGQEHGAMSGASAGLRRPNRRPDPVLRSLSRSGECSSATPVPHRPAPSTRRRKRAQRLQSALWRCLTLLARN